MEVKEGKKLRKQNDFVLSSLNGLVEVVQQTCQHQ